jgi:hypothetical protein
MIQHLTQIGILESPIVLLAGTILVPESAAFGSLQPVLVLAL